MRGLYHHGRGAILCLAKRFNREFSSVSEIESPCISMCSLDLETNSCPSCGRTLDEIKAWKLATDDEKLEILAAMARRRAEAAVR